MSLGKRIYLGPAGIPLLAKGKGLVEGIRTVSKLGLSALELQLGHGINIGLELARKAGETAEKEGVRLSVHAPYFINLNSKEKRVIQESKKRLLKSAEIAEAAGAGIVVFHAGFYSDLSSQDATERMKKAILEVRENAPESVVLGVETMGKKNSWGTLDEIAQVCGKGVVPVLDFAHIHARGRRLDSKEKIEKLFEEYESIFNGFLHSHFTGIVYGPLGEKHHVPIEEGEPDFSLLAPFLKTRKYPCTVICESPLLEQDSLRMKRALEL